MNLPEVKIEDLLEAGVHFGHNVRRWNPKMENYIFGVRNNIHIFDLRITLEALNASLVKMHETISKSGKSSFALFFPEIVFVDITILFDLLVSLIKFLAPFTSPNDAQWIHKLFIFFVFKIDPNLFSMKFQSLCFIDSNSAYIKTNGKIKNSIIL